MGTTAQKLEYLGTTKSQLKDMINYGLDDNNKITNSTTFRKYVTSIFNAFLEALRTPDTLFTNLPKKSGTGANITLNDTANAPMRIELGARELTQAGTPTPSSPQDIHTISGSNTIKIYNRNIWDEEWELGKLEANNTLSTFGQKVNSTTQIRAVNYIKVQPNTTYYCYRGGSTGAILVIAYDENKNAIASWNYKNATNTTFTTPANAEYILWYANAEYGTTYGNNICINISDSNNGTYTKHSGTDYSVNLKSRNMLDQTSMTTYQNCSINVGGEITSSALSNWNVIGLNCNNIKLEKDTYYYATFKAKKISGSGGFNYGGVLQDTSQNVNTSQFSIIKPDLTNEYQTYCWRIYTDNASFVGSRLFLQANGSTSSLVVKVKDIMFSKVENDEYVPYYDYGDYSKISTYEDKFFKTIDGDEVYDSLDSATKQTLISNEWYIKKNIGKVVLDGTEEWSAGTSGAYYRFNTEITDLYYVDDRGINVKSNYFNASITDNYGIIYTWRNRIFVYPSDTTITTDTALKTWLSTHNTEVYYVMASPTYTKITGTLAEQLENVYKNMLSQKGTTNISQVNNDLAFILNVSAIEE